MDNTRRSSRAARSSQPLASSASHHSSASSNSSMRAERATRSHQKTESPRKSTPSASLSSEPLDETMAIADDAMQTRRKRGRAEDLAKISKPQASKTEMTNGIEEVGEDDEAVRCICGFEEYPGPPPISEDIKHGIKDSIQDSEVPSGDIGEDLAGFFLQCDDCKVWQHGGCVGIMNEDTSPEEYFCEQCRKNLHRMFTAPTGQRYSHYLPLHQSLSAATSRAASFSKDGTKSPRSKSGRPSSSMEKNAKRRSTMNSRAAYDEDEELRRAIAASKGENSGESTEGAPRRGKRGRSDSVEQADDVKRQRTTSHSPSPLQDQQHFVAITESDDTTNERTAGLKKIRGAAARNHREKELREEKERSRQEAVTKRKGRAERRRVEESEPPEENPLLNKVFVNKPADVPAQAVDPSTSSQAATPDTPPIISHTLSHKKGGRPPHSRKGKLGKNQYTKEKDVHDGDDRSPGRSQSRDFGRDDCGHPPITKNPYHEAKHGKSKTGGSKITMSDMRKRVATILDFISRTQIELAGDYLSPVDSQVTKNLVQGLADGLPMIKLNGEKERERPSESSPAVKDFKDLSCLEMMDVLTRQLVRWQKEFT